MQNQNVSDPKTFLLIGLLLLESFPLKELLQIIQFHNAKWQILVSVFNHGFAYLKDQQKVYK